MEVPRRDVPRSILSSGAITALAYGIPILGIVTVLPRSKIQGISGFLDAVHQTFGVYGGAQNFLTDLMALGFIFALVTSGAVWMMGSDRIQAVAGYDGAFIGWFGVFSQRFGTPVRVNVMSGITSTIFMVAAVNLLQGSEAAVFGVVLNMAVSTTLVSYLLIFPTLIKLRRDYPDVPRPFMVPGGEAGARAPVRRELRLPLGLGRDAGAVRGVHPRDAGDRDRVRAARLRPRSGRAPACG